MFCHEELRISRITYEVSVRQVFTPNVFAIAVTLYVYLTLAIILYLLTMTFCQ